VGSNLIELTPELFNQDLRIDPILNHCIERYSSRNLPLKDSFDPFGRGFSRIDARRVDV
jgi:hypothetical protein